MDLEMSNGILPAMSRVLRGPARAIAGLLAAVAASGCVATPAPADVHAIAETITVGDGGLQPAAEVQVPTFGSVLFRNGRTAGIEVELARPVGASASCATTLHFADASAHAQAAIAPGGIAAICFHEAGTFPFAVRSADREWRGVVRVGGR